MDQPLRGRTALVTGANHGIGAATAIELARLGAAVGLTYLRGTGGDGTGLPDVYVEARAADASSVIAEIEAGGGRAVAVEADLADPTMPAHVLDRIEFQLGTVSILVNNASGWSQDSFTGPGVDDLGRPMAPVTEATFEPQFLVDARAGALLIGEVARRVRDAELGWGRIIGLTSGSPDGFPGEVSYGAAKAALENYTMSAATELAADGFTANVVHPPVTDTGWVTDAVRAFVAADADHHHVAEPAEVARIIGWLCTPTAALVTGNRLRLR